MSINPLQMLNSIPNPGGTGLPVQQYASEMQQALQAQLETIPNNELSTLSSTQSALNQLQPALQQLQSATQTLASSLTWNTSDLSTTGTGFTATASAGAQPSSYSLAVNSLAQSQWNTSTIGLATSTGASTLTAGVFTITPSTTASVTGTATITVTAGESLSDIVSSVNQNTADTGVVASIINNNGSYQLSFQDTNAGANNSFQLTDTSGDVIATQLNVTQVATATDASITLDGSVNLTSSSNTFNNAIPNVDIQVTQAGTTGTLTLAQNTNSAVQAVQTFMNAYNSVISTLNSDTAYTPASSSGQSASTGALFSDPVATGLLSQLPTAINSFIASTSGTNNLFQSLAQIGIVVNPNNGNLQFQSASNLAISGSSGTNISLPSGQTMFTNALKQNASQVQQLFGVIQTTSLSSETPTQGILGNVNTVLNEFLGSGSQTGAIQGELTSISAQQKSINQYLTQVNQMIQSNIQNYTLQLNTLNANIQQTTSQMTQLQSLMGGGSSSSSSSSSGSSTSGT